ncbi:MAG: acyl-CoA/acyl-ACP dehydrogenase [Dehalococcoidia bacterium]|jgi:alkylation response protein AidB-like acyl-CoA dehydrogenase|nr:acyl-CoA/acyl-ACP dehydrogenase [Dehalococcoidia bacterium]
MNVQLNETQQMLKASAREFLSEICPPKKVREMRAMPAGFSPELWKEMGSLGWLGLAFPESAGGSAMPFLDLCLLIEELGHACVPSPFLESIAGAGLLLAEAGGTGREELLTAVAAGGKLVVPAFHGIADDEGRRVLPSMQRDGNDYVIDGTHLFVPYGGYATHFVCLATVAGQPDDPMLFLIPASSPGVTVIRLRSMRDERPSRLELAGVTLAADALLASGEEVTKLVRRALNRMDAARCFDIVGALSWVLEDTVSYAKDRKQFGQPIGSFQVLQHYCADMHVMLEGLKMAALHTGWRLSEGLEADREVAVVCAYAHSVVPRFLALAHQIHGAMGVTIEHDLHLYSTRAFAPGHSLAPLSEYLEAALTV